MGKILALLVALLVAGCDAASQIDRVSDWRGVIECTSPVAGAPVYSFDTGAEESLFWWSTNSHYLEFRDLATGEIVKLRQDNMRYNCESAPAAEEK